MAKRNPTVVGLDIGTYKVGVIVAEVGDDGVEITGIGTASSSGLKKGTVVNIEATVEAIRKAVDEAELMAATEMRSVVAGAEGSHIKGINTECKLVAICADAVGVAGEKLKLCEPLVSWLLASVSVRTVPAPLLKVSVTEPASAGSGSAKSTAIGPGVTVKPTGAVSVGVCVVVSPM